MSSFNSLINSSSLQTCPADKIRPNKNPNKIIFFINYNNYIIKNTNIFKINQLVSISILKLQLGHVSFFINH